MKGRPNFLNWNYTYKLLNSILTHQENMFLLILVYMFWFCITPRVHWPTLSINELTCESLYQTFCRWEFHSLWEWTLLTDVKHYSTRARVNLKGSLFNLLLGYGLKSIGAVVEKWQVFKVETTFKDIFERM